MTETPMDTATDEVVAPPVSATASAEPTPPATEEQDVTISSPPAKNKNDDDSSMNTEEESSPTLNANTTTGTTAATATTTAAAAVAADDTTENETTAEVADFLTTRLSKKRSRSPETTIVAPTTTAKDPPPTSSTTTTTTTTTHQQQQHQVAAVSAASAAAAAQLCLSMGWNGLYSLLSATSLTTATSLSLSGNTGGADASSSGAGGASSNTTSGGSSSNSSNNSSLPTVEQVRQAALKSVQDSPPQVHLSKTDSAPQLKIADDRRLVVKGGMRGYRMARATHGISSGNYYYEVLILDPPPVSEIVASLPPNARLGKTLQNQLQQALLEEEQGTPLEKRTSTFGGHVRLGWSMRTGDLQAPVGYDKWSYGVRDIGGSKIHCSRRDDHWGGESFGPGDVVGCAIYLGGGEDSGKNGDTGGNTSNDKDATSSSSGMIGRDSSLASSSSSSAGGGGGVGSSGATSNHIRFFKNGNPMGHFVISKGKREGGVAFTVPDGVYYPAISLYMGASVKVNFGPHFVCPPRKLPAGLKNSMQPVSELYQPSKPMPVQDATTKVQKEKIFRKPDMMAKFVELVQTEAQVLSTAHDEHCKKHVLEIKAEREKRNLSIVDLDVPETAVGDATADTTNTATTMDEDNMNSK